MSFGSALSIATSGMNAASARAQTAANNIANANTEGYTRRLVETSERVTGRAGAGVIVEGTSSARGGYLTTNRMRLEADSGYAAERAAGAERLTQMIGEPGVEDGLFRAYAQFENALKDAAATPESAVLLRQAVGAADELARSFRTLSAQVDAERSAADRKIGTRVDEINSALGRLEELNRLPLASVTPEVLDERQRLVDNVNRDLAVTAKERDGKLQLYTEGGVALLTERARTIEFSSAGNVGQTQTLGSPLSGLTVDGVDITPASGAPQQSKSGSLAALFELRDRTLPGFQDQLDALATDVFQRFADPAVDPTLGATDYGIFTTGQPTAPTTVEQGAASRLQVNAAIDPAQGGALYRLRDGVGATSEGPAGNGDILARLVSAFETPRPGPTELGVPGDRSAASLAAEVASGITFDYQYAADGELFARTRFEVAEDAELAVTAVDTDQELQQLLLIEQAYAANARVVQTVNTLIQTLLSI